MKGENKKHRQRRKRKKIISLGKVISYSVIILSVILIYFFILHLQSDKFPQNKNKYGAVIKTLNFTQVGNSHILFFYVENKENITKDCTVAVSVNDTSQEEGLQVKDLMPFEKRNLNVTIYNMPKGTSKTILSLNCTVSKK